MFQPHIHSQAVITNIGKFRETGDGTQETEVSLMEEPTANHPVFSIDVLFENNIR
jgi:hypothetical protein